MTASETSPSVHLQYLKNRLPVETIPSSTCPKETSKDISDPSSSPTNNNNNNTTTSSNSNIIVYNSSNPGLPNTDPSSGFILHNHHSSQNNSLVSATLLGGLPNCTANSCCSLIPVVESNSGEGTAPGVPTEPRLSECTHERDKATEDCAGRSCLKISENHLSTKLLRSKSVPYSAAPNSKTGVVHVKQNQDRSNHSRVNPSTLDKNCGSTATTSFITLPDDDEVTFDNVPVNSSILETNHTCNGFQGSNSSSFENNHNSPNLMGSTSLLTSGITSVNSNGLIHPTNNMGIKPEQNGNNMAMDIAMLDNQYHHNHSQPLPHIHHSNHPPQSYQQQHQHLNGADCCMNHSTINGDNSPGVVGIHHHSHHHQDSFLGSHNNQQNNCNPNNHLCPNGLFVNSCAHNCGGMSLAMGNGSVGSISGTSNCAGSMTSPGGSLDEHDCDDDKVINGDTFASGDLPDPDAIKMFVGQVPKHLNETELRTLFEEFGRVFQINVLRDKVTKQSKGCCFVTYYARKSALDAQNALHNVKTLPGMNHPIQMKPADNENRYERKLFVGMLSRKCQEADVRTMFSRYGVIDECTVLRDTSGQSRGCAFVTFASKQSAQNAIKAVHHSTTMEGCSSPLVVKFADTQKDKDQKRQQNIHANILGNIPTVNPLSQPYFNGILKLEQIIQQLQQQQQQQQHQQHQSSYFSQLSPLGMQSLGGLGALGNAGGSGIHGLGSAHSSQTSAADLATLAALANLTNVSGQHPLAVGVQNLATLAALGNSSLSPSGANGGSLGSSNALALTGNGLHSGLGSFSSAMRGQPVASKQPEGPEGANLFIYHLPPECGDPDLAAMFTPYGNVISAKVFVDKQTNLSKCFGFVSFDNPPSAQLAIQAMNGFQIGMKRLKVQLKRSKEAAKPY